MATAQASAAKADADVAALAARFALERNAVPASPANGPSLAEPHSQAPVPPGCVTITFAEEKWAEREAAYALQIAQLQALLPAVDAVSEASPSEAGDLELADPLDDSAWGKVERSKRLKLLGMQKEVLARNVRTKLSHVSVATSPFGKA